MVSAKCYLCVEWSFLSNRILLAGSSKTWTLEIQNEFNLYCERRCREQDQLGMSSKCHQHSSWSGNKALRTRGDYCATSLWKRSRWDSIDLRDLHDVSTRQQRDFCQSVVYRYLFCVETCARRFLSVGVSKLLYRLIIGCTFQCWKLAKIVLCALLSASIVFELLHRGLVGRTLCSFI